MTIFNNSKINTVAINVAVWIAILLTISTLIFVFGNEKAESFGLIFLQAITGFGIVIIPTVYVNTSLLIPKFLAKKKYVHYAFWIILFALIWGPIAVYLENWTDFYIFKDDKELVDDLTPGIYIILFILVLSTMINLSYKWFIQLSAITRMENDRLNIELSLLRSQINPHFFFNTLNNLYSLSLENSKKTPEVILKLSEMMRYTIYDCKSHMVAIKNEIKYLENYISLQQIRLQNRGDIKFDAQIEDDNMQIAPMVFIVFLENAFKHGIEKMTEGSYIDMKLHCTSEKIIFQIENNFEHEEPDNDDQHGVGLENVKRRLELIYPGMYNLNIDEGNKIFKVKMEINHSLI